MLIFRRIVQVIFLAAFLALFIFTTLGPGFQVPENYFFYFSPLLSLSLLLSAHYTTTLWIIAPLSLLLLTLILGRFFCGWICPLGLCIDISDRIFRFTKRKKAGFPSQARFYVLGGLIAAGIIGVNLFYHFQPLVILYRTLAFVFFPLLQRFVPNIGDFPLHPESSVTYIGTWSFLVIFLVILFISFFGPRFWCRNLCPEGALLSLLSRFSPLRRFSKPGCSGCGDCRTTCPGGRNNSDCIRCMQCLAACKEKNAGFSFKISRRVADLDIGRRAMLLSGLAGAAIAVGFTLDPLKKKLYPRLIRPPAALPEEKFVNQCVRCGECMKVCPTGGLQPCFWESGIEGMWTPRLVPVLGECVESCTMCGNICPTGAIQKIKPEDKKYMPIGTASINKKACIAWAENKQCMVCQEFCPYLAIWAVPRGKINVPEVNIRNCVGCGICERNCPAVPDRAIKVYSPIGAGYRKRLRTGGN